jgi:hypothetical protein
MPQTCVPQTSVAAITVSLCLRVLVGVRTIKKVQTCRNFVYIVKYTKALACCKALAVLIA